MRHALASLAAIVFVANAVLAENESPALPPVTFGLDATIRLEAAREPGPTAKRALTRIRPSLALAPAEGFTMLVQGQWYGASRSGEGGSGVLYQAYGDYSRDRIEARVGRQEIVFGSGFLLGADAFHDGAAYDAVRLIVRPAANIVVDLFGGREAAVLSCGSQRTIAGAALRSATSWGAVEAYALGEDDGAGRVASAGALVTATAGPVTIEAEPVLQRGWRLDPEGRRLPVAAWAGHAELTWSLRGPGGPTLGVAYALASGDAAPGRGRETEFRHAGHDTSIVGEIGIVPDLSSFAAGAARASGLRAAALLAEIPVAARIRLALALRRFGAADVAGASSHAIGHELDTALSIAARHGVDVTIAVDRFQGGPFYRQATRGPSAITYGYVAVAYRY